MGLFKKDKTNKATCDGCDRCKCEYPCSKEDCYRPIYTVTCVLNQDYWNEDLKRYLAVGINEQNSLLISETEEVTFVHTGGVWNLIEAIQSGKVTKITITQSIMGTPEEIVKEGIN